MKFDFAGAIKKALDGSDVDEQIQSKVEHLIQNQKDAAARIVDEGKAPKAVKPHEDEQVRLIATQAIEQSSLMSDLKAALIEECVSAARPKAEKSTGAGAEIPKTLTTSVTP